MTNRLYLIFFIPWIFSQIIYSITIIFENSSVLDLFIPILFILILFTLDFIPYSFYIEDTIYIKDTPSYSDIIPNSPFSGFVND